jgi:glutathione S-transferase
MLWHSVDARSLRCLWALEELGITDYKLVTMPFPPRFFHKGFLKTNVLGTIPYFTDDGHGMTESSAVCQYLVAKYGGGGSTTAPTPLALQPSEPEYAEYLNWLHHADATLTFPQTIVLRYTVLEAGKCCVAAEDYAKWYLARLRLLDNVLSDGREFLVGNRFTIADICVAFALYVSHGRKLKVGVDGELISNRYKPQTKAYLERLMQRPAFVKCLELQERSLKEFTDANQL